MNWLALVKFLVGFSLAIALLFFAGVSTTRYLITRLTAPPPRPSFPNDDPNFTLDPASPQASPATVAPAATPTATSAPSPTASASPSPTPDEPGAYDARVTQSIGLVVRQDPSRSASQVGGVSFNQSVVVLETSADGEWQRVRVGDNGIEGWVSAGNTEPIN